jgi:hypothetical protein
VALRRLLRDIHGPSRDSVIEDIQQEMRKH